MKARKVWKKRILLLLLLCIGAAGFTLWMCKGYSEKEEVSADGVYKRFYFQGGLHILPGKCISYTWTYMEEGDTVRIVVNGNGTLKAGICRFSDSKKFGLEQTGNFAMTMVVPSSGYYKLFIINPSDESVTFKGVAVCSHPL